MLDNAKLLAIWFEFNQAFNRGDLEACATHIAEDFNAMASETFMASKAEFVAAARNGQSNGWTGQQMISVDAGGNMIVARYYNVFADDSRTEGAAVVLFNDEGKMTRVRTVNNSGSTAMLPPA